MIIFGMNLPLAEIFFILVMLFLVFLIMIIMQLQKLQKMTNEEKKELEELEKLAQEEKKDLEDIKSFEQRESQDISKFEKDIMDLEEDTDTLYLKKLAPDLYKIQNYTLWALKKGMNPKQIKETLISKGWKDRRLVEMIVEDTLKYSGYYANKKGDVQVPDIKIEEELKIVDKPAKVVEKPINIVKVVKTEPKEEPKQIEMPKIALQKEPIKQPVKSISQKPKMTKLKLLKKDLKPAKPKKIVTAKLPEDSFGSIEKELTKLEKDLKSKEKKTEEQKPPKKTDIKKPVKKEPAKNTKSAPQKKGSGKKEQTQSKNQASKKTTPTKAAKKGKGKNDTVHIVAKKGSEVKVTYK